MTATATEYGFRYIPRCREQMDQCRLPNGELANAVCRKMDDRYAYECPNCGRQYSALHAEQYRDRCWVEPGDPLPEGSA